MAGLVGVPVRARRVQGGLVNRRALLRDASENVLFRLRGSTDAGHRRAARTESASCCAACGVRDLQRLAPDVLAGVLPRLYPQMLDLAYRHQDAGRPIVICTAASQEMADLLAIVLTFDGAVGSVSRSSTASTRAARAGRSPTARARRRRSASWPSARTSTSARLLCYSGGGTRSPTCRCCARSAPGIAVNPDGKLARCGQGGGLGVPALRGLNRRLRYAGALLGAPALGGAGSPGRRAGWSAP
jgi:phosphoserine phosphatase